jgi:hypothetical protein
VIQPRIPIGLFDENILDLDSHDLTMGLIHGHEKSNQAISTSQISHTPVCRRPDIPRQKKSINGGFDAAMGLNEFQVSNGIESFHALETHPHQEFRSQKPEEGWKRLPSRILFLGVLF